MFWTKLFILLSNYNPKEKSPVDDYTRRPRRNIYCSYQLKGDEVIKSIIKTNKEDNVKMFLIYVLHNLWYYRDVLNAFDIIYLHKFLDIE